MNVVSIEDKINMTIPCLSQAFSSSDYNELINKPAIEGHILVDNQTAEELGLYGVNNPETFVFEQKTPSDTWEIEHPLNKLPSCTVIDSANSVVVGNVEYIDDSHVVITFSGAFSGTALLN